MSSLRKLIDTQLNDPFTDIEDLGKLIDSLHDHICSTMLQPNDVISTVILCIVVRTTDVLPLSFCHWLYHLIYLQLILRNFLFWSFIPLSSTKFCNESNRYLPLPFNAQSFILSLPRNSSPHNFMWIDDLRRSFDSSYDGIIDCASLLLKVGPSQIFHNSGIVLLHEVRQIYSICTIKH
jgi:hypothetical protein